MVDAVLYVHTCGNVGCGCETRADSHSLLLRDVTNTLSGRDCSGRVTPFILSPLAFISRQDVLRCRLYLDDNGKQN